MDRADRPVGAFLHDRRHLLRRLFHRRGREDGLDQIELHRYDPAIAPVRLKFPEASYVAGLGDNPEYAMDKLRIGYESMVTPGTVYDYTVATGELETLKVQEIPRAMTARSTGPSG